jgi:hypothetical protein
MPRQACQVNGKPGYRWGESGTCYTYTSGDKASRERAKAKADKQGRAIKASQGK